MNSTVQKWSQSNVHINDSSLNVGWPNINFEIWEFLQHICGNVFLTIQAFTEESGLSCDAQIMAEPRSQVSRLPACYWARVSLADSQGLPKPSPTRFLQAYFSCFLAKFLDSVLSLSLTINVHFIPTFLFKLLLIRIFFKSSYWSVIPNPPMSMLQLQCSSIKPLKQL